MKNISNLLLLSLTLVYFSSEAQAQEQACFMQDANGKPLDLSYLCGNYSPNSPNLGQSRSKPAYEPGVHTIPIVRRNAGIPVIKVKFNDKYEFEMMLDTGASITVLTEQMAKILGFKSQGSLPIQTPSNELVYFPWGQVRSIATAGAVAENVPVVVSPSMPIGLLGQNFFGNYDLTIEYGAVKLRER
ncbi:retropepsin-like aspartic protease family protein [Myxosarcina sp. GI1(2024)]